MCLRTNPYHQLELATRRHRIRKHEFRRFRCRLLQVKVLSVVSPTTGLQVRQMVRIRRTIAEKTEKLLTNAIEVKNLCSGLSRVTGLIHLKALPRIRRKT